MVNFNYTLPTRLIFGRDTHRKAGTELRRLGAKRLWCSSAGGAPSAPA